MIALNTLFVALGNPDSSLSRSCKLYRHSHIISSGKHFVHNNCMLRGTGKPAQQICKQAGYKNWFKRYTFINLSASIQLVFCLQHCFIHTAHNSISAHCTSCASPIILATYISQGPIQTRKYIKLFVTRTVSFF